MVDDKSFRDELVAFSIAEESSVVDGEHREELMPFLLRFEHDKSGL